MAQSSTLDDRSRARGRPAIVLADNLRTYTPVGSLLLRAFLGAHEGVLLVCTPARDPDANRIEWIWRSTVASSPTPVDAPTSPTLTTDLAAPFTDLARHLGDVPRHVGSPRPPRPHPAPTSS